MHIPAWHELSPAANRKEKVNLVRIAAPHHLLCEQLILPVAGECPEHVQANQDAVDDLPRAGIISEHGEFKPVTTAVRFYKRINAARIRGEILLVRIGKSCGYLLGDAPQPE